MRDNNGRLLASYAYLSKRGWKSKSLIQKTKDELLRAGFIFETVMGQRPNKAGWYAVTWRALDRHAGYDQGSYAAYVRGAYRNAVLSPSYGAERRGIAPCYGARKPPLAPSYGAMQASSAPLPSPSCGEHLENHLHVVGCPAVGTGMQGPKTAGPLAERLSSEAAATGEAA